MFYYVVVILFLDCFKEDKKIQGHWIKSVKNVDNVNKCQQHCQDQADCTAFVYTVEEKNCALKNPAVAFESIQLKNAIGKITGPRNCAGK